MEKSPGPKSLKDTTEPMLPRKRMYTPPWPVIPPAVPTARSMVPSSFKSANANTALPNRSPEEAGALKLAGCNVYMATTSLSGPKHSKATLPTADPL